MLRNAVTKVEVDKALIRNPGISRHAFEVCNNVFRQAHRHRLLELGCVGVLARLQLGKVVFGSHRVSLP